MSEDKEKIYEKQLTDDKIQTSDITLSSTDKLENKKFEKENKNKSLLKDPITTFLLGATLTTILFLIITIPTFTDTEIENNGMVLIPRDSVYDAIDLAVLCNQMNGTYYYVTEDMEGYNYEVITESKCGSKQRAELP